MPNKINAILVDDETHSREILMDLLSAYCGDEIAVAGEASNVEAAFDLISALQPDLVFLDIQMPRADGFSLLRKFESINFETIFVTSYDQYAITAIRFSALDYLVKPVEIEELTSAVHRAVKVIREKKNTKAQMTNLINSLKADEKEKKVAVHFNDEVRFLSPADMVYIEAEGRYCRIYLQNQEHYILPKSLKDFECYFGEHSPFIRISKSYLVNTDYIKWYSKGDPCMIKLKNDQVLEVSRRKKHEILELIKK